MGTQTGQELEYRQCQIYVIIAIIIYFFTGYFIVTLLFVMLIYTILEEIDPEEIDDIEELSPFIEHVYTNNDFVIVSSFLEDVKLNEADNIKKKYIKFKNDSYCYKNHADFYNFYLNLNKENKILKDEILYISLNIKKISLEEEEEFI